MIFREFPSYQQVLHPFMLSGNNYIPSTGCVMCKLSVTTWPVSGNAEMTCLIQEVHASTARTTMDHRLWTIDSSSPVFKIPNISFHPENPDLPLRKKTH